MTELSSEQKEQAAKALWNAHSYVYSHFGESAERKLNEFIEELAKVNLAIQPIEKKPLLKDLPTCE
jgi:hypothetical protein